MNLICHGLMISIIESIAKAENESRSENIRWSINQACVVENVNVRNSFFYSLVIKQWITKICTTLSIAIYIFSYQFNDTNSLLRNI